MPRGYAGDSVCESCMALPPPFSRLYSAYIYQPPVSALISSYKYHGKLVYGKVLSLKLAATLETAYGDNHWPHLLVPVPLHAKRIRQRGFNQALEIARWLSAELDLPFSYQVVNRSKDTAQQAGLSAAARRKNIRGAFRIAKPEQVSGKRLAIVEDVVTTSITVTELARVLMKAGASEIHVWSLARTCL